MFSMDRDVRMLIKQIAKNKRYKVHGHDRAYLSYICNTRVRLL